MGGPKFRAFSSLSRHRFAVSVSLWVSFSWNFGVHVWSSRAVVCRRGFTRQPQSPNVQWWREREEKERNFGRSGGGCLVGFAHPDLTNFGQSNFGQSIFGHRGFGPANFGQSQFWPIQFWPIQFWPIQFGPRRVRPRRVGPRKGGAPKGWGPERVGPRKGGAPKGWGPERVGPRKGGAPKGWGPERVGPRKGGGPKFRAFFPSPATVFYSFFPLFWSFSWNFGGV